MAYERAAIARARGRRDMRGTGGHAGEARLAVASPAIAPRPAAAGNVVELRPALPRPCPELDCIRDRLSRATVAMAERRAAELGIGADRVLVAAGIIREEDYIAALCGHLGVRYEFLDRRPRRACPLDDGRMIEAPAVGLLPLRADGEFVWVVAPRNLAARTLMRLIAAHPYLARRIRLTSSAQLNQFVARHGSRALGTRAALALRRRWPQLSAAPWGWRISVGLALAAAIVPALFVVFPDQAKLATEAMLAGGFLAWLALRVAGSLIEPVLPRPARLPGHALPVYTLIVPLYREAASVAALVAALRELDYPPEKLDIKLVVEADDLETGIALARLDLGAPFEVIVAPAIGPRTKPKALNAALPFARGTFTAIYDAEDRPEPDQLRCALDVFLASGEDLACVQARLTIDNTADGWLARLFTAEYAAQFDLFLPGLAALGLPLPLGGSSNHFRTAVLREIGAWDAHNVTEDADLGIRLARFGYRSTVIASSTYEEAPARFGPWLRQRTRWFKGWMQTWAVHMRSPLALLAELGPAGFATLQLVVGGNVLAALVHPIFLAAVVYALASGIPILGTDGPLVTTLAWLYGTTLGAGYLISIVLGVRGLARRGLLSAAWALALMPLYWLLLSLAAWRALYQLMRDPHGWEKTEHGLARSSRLASMNSASVLRAVFRSDREEEWQPRREAAE
jgi:cellulose synthase/poly-beta-1,6-N-acetylglucosamine synthase-like glycosyltransferase